MSRPKAYKPVEGCRYQLFCRHPAYNGREWEHCDYAEDRADKKHLLTNYRMAYGPGYQFKSILLPMKFWPKRQATPTSGVSNP